MEKYFDTHVHLDHPWIADDIQDVLARAAGAGVAAMVTIGMGNSCQASLALSETYPQIWASVGLHPTMAREWNDDLENSLRQWLKLPKVVAVGETGLDYYKKTKSPHPVQKEVFRRQLQLAAEYELPVIVHVREAVEDTIKIIREYAPLPRGGVMHSFPGSLQAAMECVAMGFKIALGGPVIHDRLAQETAAGIPLECLLLETDCPRPWLAPHPYGNQPNQPHFISLVAQEIARIRGISLEELSQATWTNACELYDILL